MRPNSLFLAQPTMHRLLPRRYYAINYSFFEMDMHTHNECELMYVAHGKCMVDVADQSLLLKEGDLIFIDGDISHRLTVERGNPCRILNLESTLVASDNAQIFTQLNKNDDFRFFFCNAPESFVISDSQGILHHYLRNLLRLLRTHSSPDEIDAQLLLLLAEIARRYYLKWNQKRTGISKPVLRALDFIEENYQTNLSAGMIATHAGLSKSHLQRMFHAQTGKTITETINIIRIEKAELLLSVSRLPVIDVALEAGFNNRQHFTEIFKRVHGCSPAIYRKHIGNEKIYEGFNFTDLPQ